MSIEAIEATETVDVVEGIEIFEATAPVEETAVTPLEEMPAMNARYAVSGSARPAEMEIPLPVATAELPEPVKIYKQFPIERVTVKESIQVRVNIDAATVEEYTKIVKERDMDEWDLFEKDGVYLLADGFQRRMAYLKNGRVVAPVRIRPGGESEALEFAMRINCSHGTRMTNADKRRSVELAVADARIGQFTDKRIARMCRVSDAFVSQVRRGESPAAGKLKREKHTRKVKVKAHDRAVTTKPPVTVHERAPEPPRADGVSDRLHTLKEWIQSGKISEEEILNFFATENHRYKFFAKDGRKITVKLKGKANRYRNFTAVIDSMEEDVIALTVSKGFKFEVEG